MIETKPGAEDGIHVVEYQKGHVYNLSDELARVFIREGWAEKVTKRGPRTRKTKQAHPPKGKR